MIIGGLVIGAGIALYSLGAQSFGETLVGAGVAFLGVGSGVAASS